MNLYDEKISWIAALLGTLFTWLFGAWDIALQILITFMILDYATGLLRGYAGKNLSSDTGLKGIARKCIILAVLIVAVLLDRLINIDNWIFRTLICYFYIANEALSILENCSVLGLPIPSKLQDALEQLKEGNKKSKFETKEEI